MRRFTPVALATLVAPLTVIVVVILAMHPALLVTNSTTTGGDTGSHVAIAWFLRANLLPHFHLTGWDAGWYDGFPLFTFYFPFPDLIAALGSYVIPGNIAFKFATLLGSVTLPIAAWAFGRLAGLARPRPALLAAFTLPFLFDQTYQIYGGNLLSTMAGEYAYSLGLSVAVLYLGVVVYGLRTGRLRWVGAVLLAICVVCHLVGTLFALVGVVLAFLLGPPSKQRAWWVVSSVGAGALLTAWWWVPFILQQSFTTSMGYTNVRTFVDTLLPEPDRWALVLAAVGVVIGILRRQRGVLLLGGLGIASLLAVLFDPQGKLYNVRFLPLWFLCAYLLAGITVTEGLVLLARLWRAARTALWRATVGLTPAWGSKQSDEGWPPEEPLPELPRRPRWRSAPAALGGPIAGAVISCLIVVPLACRLLLEQFREHPELDGRGSPRHSPDTHPAQHRDRLGLLELHRLPGKVGLARVLGSHDDDDRPGRALRMRQSDVGVQLVARPVRDPRIADGPADVDRRMHQLDGRTVVRVLVVDALSLLEPGRALGSAVGGHGRRERVGIRRSRHSARNPAPAASRSEVLHGVVRGGGTGSER